MDRIERGGCGEGEQGGGVRGEGGVMSTKHEAQAQLLTCSRPDSHTLTWSNPRKVRKVRNKEKGEKITQPATWQMACHALTN